MRMVNFNIPADERGVSLPEASKKSVPRKSDTRDACSGQIPDSIMGKCPLKYSRLQFSSKNIQTLRYACL